MRWYLTALKKYAVFSGRARRSEFWYFELFNILLPLGGALVLEVLLILVGTKPDDASTIAIGLYDLWFLAMLLPHWGVTVRRLHDTGRTGWWTLITLIPLIGPIILLIFLCEDSQPDTNQWGSNPKTTTDAAPALA